MSDPRIDHTARAETIRVPAIHLSGVRGLSPRQADLELRLSDAGLHIFDTRARTLVGQLDWTDIEGLRLPRRRRFLGRAAARLEITSRGGRACFELPGLTKRQLRDYVAPRLKPAGGPP